MKRDITSAEQQALQYLSGLGIPMEPEVMDVWCSGAEEDDEDGYFVFVTRRGVGQTPFVIVPDEGFEFADGPIPGPWDDELEEELEDLLEGDEVEGAEEDDDEDEPLASTTASASGVSVKDEDVELTVVEDEAPAEEVKLVTWSGVLGLEGSPTGDGRLLEQGSLTWPDLPIPLRYVSVQRRGRRGRSRCAFREAGSSKSTAAQGRRPLPAESDEQAAALDQGWLRCGVRTPRAGTGRTTFPAR